MDKTKSIIEHLFNIDNKNFIKHCNKQKDGGFNNSFTINETITNKIKILSQWSYVIGTFIKKYN